jgi:hypothetical protein
VLFAPHGVEMFCILYWSLCKESIRLQLGFAIPNLEWRTRLCYYGILINTHELGQAKTRARLDLMSHEAPFPSFASVVHFWISYYPQNSPTASASASVCPVDTSLDAATFINLGSPGTYKSHVLHFDLSSLHQL